MPHDLTPKPPRAPKTEVSASITLVEWQRLSALSKERRVTIPDLVRQAIRQTFPDDATKP